MKKENLKVAGKVKVKNKENSVENILNIVKASLDDGKAEDITVIDLEGKSSIRVNGLPTIQAVLKNIGQILVDSYSQHESVELLKTKKVLL